MPNIENQTNLENSPQLPSLDKIKQGFKSIFLGLTAAFVLASCAPEGNSAQDPGQAGAEGSLPGETFQDNGVTPPDDAIDLYDYYEKYKMSPEEIAKLLEEVQKMDLKKIQTADFQGYYYKLNKDLVLKDIGALVDITDEKVSYKFSEIVKLVGIAFDGQGNYKFLEDGDTNGIILKYGDYLIFANKNTGQTKSDLLRFVRENLHPSGEMKELKVNSEDVFSQSNTPEAAENILKIDGQTDSGK